ncbi:efflux RND transporter permease subunit [Marinicellulosiphila megalodicopiae]|uniref:efflux RND transporter permease subunit n=1 Tax=Marinicellulosiphila megalodicopiae TaxID=2724896 RepID=UPI003BAF72C9
MGLYHKILEHKIAANLFMLLILMAGMWGYSQLHRQLFPNTEAPVLRLTVNWENADPQTVRNNIAAPIDQQINQLNMFDFVRSTSQSGRASFFMRVNDSVNPIDAQIAVQEMVDSLSLPSAAEVEDVEIPSITEDVASLMIYGDMDIFDLTLIGQKTKLSLLNAGLAEVNLIGAPSKERVIDIKLSELSKLDLTIDQLSAKIKSHFNNVQGGTMEVGENSTQLVAKELTWTVEQLRDVIVLQTENGQIKLAQIADITEQYQNRAEVITFEGKNAIRIDVKRDSSEDTLENAEKLDTWLTAYEKTLPETLQVHLFNPVYKVVESQLALVLQNGLFGMVLVLIVLFIFLRVRIAFWVAAGIPISFLGTLAFMGITDTTLNTISLFGFVIAIGIIVDDAIVVAEDALVLEEEGMDSQTAAMTAAKRMLPAVVASSLTTIAAFLPLLLIGGSFGNFLVDIPTVITAAIIASLIECFIILPGHLGHSFTRSKKSKQPNKYRKWFDHKIDVFREGPFRKGVSYCVTHGSILMAGMLAFVLIIVGALQSERIGFQATPSLDQSQLTFSMDLINGTTFEQADQTLQEIAAVVRKIDTEENLNYIDTMIHEINHPTEPSKVELQVYFKIDTGRSLTNAEYLAKVQAAYTPNEYVLKFSSRRFFRGPSSSSDFSLRLEGDDIEVLKQAASETIVSLGKYEALSDIADDLPYGSTQYQMSLTNDAIAAGLTLDTITSQVSSIVNGLKLTDVNTAFETIPVNLKLEDRVSGSDLWLSSLPIQVGDGTSLPLGALVNLQFGQSLDRIQSRDGKLSVTITATYTGDNVDDLFSDVEQNILPTITSRFDVQPAFEGQREELNTFFTQALMAVGVALILIFIILAWVFESWLWPFAVLATIPFGIMGAISGHWIMDLPISTISIFGFIGLSGIVINDSIVLVTVFRRYLDEGLNSFDAAIKSATSRLRPVILTSITTVAGLSPLIFETSLDAVLLQPIAVSLVFGLTFSTLLILLMLPMILFNIEKIKDRVSNVFHKSTVSEH